MKTLCSLLLVIFAIYGSIAVDRNNFKTCEQSGFCKRLRSQKPEKSAYVLDLKSVVVKGDNLQANVETIDRNAETRTVLHTYALKITSIKDSTFRVEIQEANPLYPRYVPQLALKQPPTPDGLQLISKDDNQVVAANTLGHRIVITADPLKIEFQDLSKETSVVLNENNQLFVEPLVKKKEATDDDQGVQEAEEEGTWGENFKSHHDSKPRGNEAISLDVAFPDADHAYGIPEHSDNVHLKTTTSGEPYRLYNLDVFEYELDSRMAIYAAVPVMYAHGSKRTVGVFWHNAAETWVDVVNYADSNVVSSIVNLVTGGQKRRVDARFMSESGVLDIFVMMGDKPQDVMRQYTALTGTTPLPPKFSLAYHQSRWNYVDENDVASVNEGFDAHDIPADVIWLDIEYTNGKKYFTWDAEKFTHPKEMVSNLTAVGRKLVVIIDPHIKREAGYFVHEDATERGYYVKNKDGKDYEESKDVEMVSNLTAVGRKLVVIIYPHNKREAGYFVHEDATERGYYVKNKDGKDYEESKDVEMVSNLTAVGRKLVVIIDPHIKREAGYFVHEDATERRYYVKNKDGKDYEGWCWPGSSSYLDFMNPEVTEYYASRYRYENFPGTSKDVHIWNDMNEPSVFNGPEITMPKDNRHYKEPNPSDEGIASFWEHRHIHNEYGLFHINATHRGMLERDNGKYRPFILTRSGFAGSQRYAAIWTGDNAAEWGFLAASIPMCLSLAISGISFCGSDVGGFFKYPDSELMTRWYQAGAYQPFFRAHSHIETKRREPWLYDSQTLALIRDANRRRYALLDFWYTLFFEQTQDGLPVFRPLFVEYGDEPEVLTIDNQHLLGNKLLVRPVVEQGASSVKVYLPGSRTKTIWYDVDSYHAYPASGYIDVETPISKIPVFQRGGSIIPRKERVRRSSALMVDDPYTLVVALDHKNSASGTLYIDDGETYEYKNNKYIYANIEYTPEKMVYRVDDKHTYPTRSWVERIVVAGIKTPPKSAKLVQGQQVTSLLMTLHKGNDVLVIRKPAAKMSASWQIDFTY